MPDVIVIRGAPGVGKSAAAKRLVERLGCGARVEVDALRAMVANVNWTDQAQHVEGLAIAAAVVDAFLAFGHRPVVVVDTFSGDKLTGFIAELRARRGEVDLRAFALFASPECLRARVLGRSEDRFKDLTVCEAQNADVGSRRREGEQFVDTSSLTPEQIAVAMLRALSDGAMNEDHVSFARGQRMGASELGAATAAGAENEKASYAHGSATPPHPDALFQVADEQPVPLAHLERVNPNLATEDKLRLIALRVGKAVELTQDGHVVRVRRTR